MGGLSASVDPLERIRAICLALPHSFEVEAWGHPTFRVGSGRGKIICTAADDGSTATVKADPLERETLLDAGDPYFLPAYVGHKGWIGVRTDDPGATWEELAELIATSYCLVAPKRLAAEVTEPPPVPG
jgi:predicted DNA-binding protein (MmcQ/YjbR family)